MVMAWTGNEARVVEFSEEELRSTAGSDPLLASIRAEGIQLAGDESLLRQVSAADRTRAPRRAKQLADAARQRA